MMELSKNGRIKGISVCNPVAPKEDYLLYTVDYAIKNGINHMQVIGPIHNNVRGNIDGMILYHKYGQFNAYKDQDYIETTLKCVNLACEKATKNGVKMYQWHHELELPVDFQKHYPETVNAFGDIEVTHPLVKDFLENKIADFFEAYPLMDGIILTLHETSIPLLKLKNQKLGKVERVKYITEILFDKCRSLGKELIVRPFASTEEDYVMMAEAYKSISENLLFMDKWTQFDWSLTLPDNAFFQKISNPLLVEADIFGEFFGKGYLPLMLKKHITEKIAYCEEFHPKGYVARIDRAGRDPFGSVNEVNLNIMNACLNGQDVEKTVFDFFSKKYPDAASEIQMLMEDTEEILKRTIYIKGYYYSELSCFPTLNHAKNHFYFEMMRDKYELASNEWFIPHNWVRGTLKSVLEEKQSAADKAEKLYEKLVTLQSKVDEGEYYKLWRMFANLKYATKIWERLTLIFMDYVKYFETFEAEYQKALEADLSEICRLRDEGIKNLGEEFYCLKGGGELGTKKERETFDFIGAFVKKIRESFRIEKREIKQRKENPQLLDFIVCGGGMEGHRLQKEVNFSDTLVVNDQLCRIPGNKRGMEWSSINAHGWFCYEVKVRPGCINPIVVTMDNPEKILDVKITVGHKEWVITEEKITERYKAKILYEADSKQQSVKIRIDKISKYTPCVYAIEVYK